MNSKDWKEIIKDIKKDPELTLETVSNFQLILNILDSNNLQDIELLQRSEYIIFKNGQKVFGNFAIDFSEDLKNYFPTIDDNESCSSQYSKYFSSLIFDNHHKIFGIQWRDYLILQKINKNYLEEKLIQSQQKFFLRRIKAFIIGLIIWFISLFFIHKEFKLSVNDMIIFGIVGIFTSLFNISTIIPSKSYSEEMTELSLLSNRCLAIASLSMGITFVLRYKKINNILYLRFILFAFILSLLSRMIPIVNKTGESVRDAIFVEKSILNFSLAYLMCAIYIYIKS